MNVITLLTTHYKSIYSPLEKSMDFVFHIISPQLLNFSHSLKKTFRYDDRTISELRETFY